MGGGRERVRGEEKGKRKEKRDKREERGRERRTKVLENKGTKKNHQF